MVRRAFAASTWAAWGACFVTGCLFRGPAEPLVPAPAPIGLSEPAAEPVATPPPAPPPSNYSPVQFQPVAQVSGAGAPPIVKASLEEVEPSTPSGPFEPMGPPRPAAPERHLVAAVRAGLEKHPEEAGRLLKGARSDRDLLLALLRLTATVGASELEKLSVEEVSRALEQVRELQGRLRGRAALRLDRAVFCRRIQGFGQYEPLPAGHSFRAGWEGRPGERVQVYAEVRNFSTVCQNGQHQSALTTRLEIRDAGGRRVAALDLGTCVDRCLAQREDYFLNIQFNVPAGLAPGLYTLWVVINDAGPRPPGCPAIARAARRSLDFRVCPPGAR